MTFMSHEGSEGEGEGEGLEVIPLDWSYTFKGISIMFDSMIPPRFDLITTPLGWGPTYSVWGTSNTIIAYNVV